MISLRMQLATKTSQDMPQSFLSFHQWLFHKSAPRTRYLFPIGVSLFAVITAVVIWVTGTVESDVVGWVTTVGLVVLSFLPWVQRNLIYQRLIELYDDSVWL